MSEIATAWVSLVPSAKGFGRATESQVGGEMRSSGSKIGKVFGSAIKAGSIAAVGGALLAGKFLKGAIDEAREAQVVTARTENVIAKMGNAAGISAKQVANLAGSISAKTGIDDEAIQSGQNLLLTFGNIRNEAGKGNDIFTQTSKLMVDMSAAMGTDAKGSAIQLGKALNDPIKGLTALSRVGVSFTAQQQEQIKTLAESGKTMQAQKIILGELSRQFGGAAAAMATPADKARVAYDNLKEQIGTALLPVLDRLLTVFSTRIVPAVSKFVKQMQNGRGAGGEFAAKMKELGDRARDFGALLLDNRSTILKFAAALVVAKVAIVAIKVAMAAYSAVQAAVNGLIVAASAVQSAYAATLALSNSYLAVWIGVKAIEAAAWLRSTAGTVAATAATVANSAATAISSANIGTRIGLMAGAVATWVAATAATIANTVATVASTTASLVAATAVKAWAAGQWLLNAALTANPIGLIVVAIALLVAGLILAYQKSETFRAVIDGVFGFLKTVVVATIGFVADHWKLIVSIIGGPLVAIGLLVIKHWSAIKSFVMSVVDAVIGFVRDHWRLIITIIGGPLGLAVALVTKHWNTIKSATVAVWNAVKSVISAAISAAKAVVATNIAAIKGAFNGLADLVGKVRGWFGEVLSAIKDKLGEAVTFVGGIPGKILSAIGDLGSLLYDKGRAIIQGLIDGIKSMAGAVGDAIAGAIPDIPGLGKISIPGPSLKGSSLSSGLTTSLSTPTSGASSRSGDALLRQISDQLALLNATAARQGSDFGNVMNTVGASAARGR